MMRMGIGQDSHPFSQNNKPLYLGGVLISETGGLKANSDGDVVIHSLCNAFSSAIGGDSLGTWADDMCLKQGITDSKEYLKFILNKVRQKGYKIGNIACSAEAKKPYLEKDQSEKIKMNLSNLLKINTEDVGITFTSGEGLTVFGKGKGIQVISIVCLTK